MKTTLYTILISTILGASLYADSSDITAKIEAIQNLPQAERVQKMNEIKAEIMQMNKEQREIVMQQLMQKHKMTMDMQNHMSTENHAMSEQQMQENHMRGSFKENSEMHMQNSQEMGGDQRSFMNKGQRGGYGQMNGRH